MRNKKQQKADGAGHTAPKARPLQGCVRLAEGSKHPALWASPIRFLITPSRNWPATAAAPPPAGKSELINALLGRPALATNAFRESTRSIKVVKGRIAGKGADCACLSLPGLLVSVGTMSFLVLCTTAQHMPTSRALAIYSSPAVCKPPSQSLDKE